MYGYSYLVEAAGVDDVEGALVVDALVELPRMEGAHGCAVVPDTVRALDDLEDSVAIRDVSQDILDPRTVPCILRLGDDIEGDDVVRAALR